MNLDQHILKTMFEKSLFSDLSVAFFHESFPFTMRFDVHKAVVAQSPFFRLLLENTHRLTTVDTASTEDSSNSQQFSSTSSSPHTTNGALHLTIDLIQAMTQRGFKMTPSQHIIRRQWQKQTLAPLNEIPSQSSSSQYKNRDGSHQVRHILGSHLRFALKWMYSMDRTSMVDTLQDEDTLRVLCVAVLFGLDTLAEDCLERYTTHQLSVDAITDDLETICQLPRDHKAYHQLRDVVLLLLLRIGPQYPRQLARLPVDYMSDVLSVDLLYIGCEYERYCLLREVLVAYMQSVGKITWTPSGPVDQDFKRLSGFVQNPFLQQHHGHSLSALDVRSSKRKRIPSEELDLISGPGGSAEYCSNSGRRSDKETPATKYQRLTRLSFSACVPFEKLVADASSGGVIDKATILSYLLRTTVNYSNMTFDQLAIVRQDGIVDESIVFRALWQREELERLLFPFNYHQNQPASASSKPATQQSIIPRFGKMDKHSSGGVGDAMDRRAALDEYFDVGDANGKEKRRRMLLGTPRFRFCASIPLILRSTDGDHGWDPVETVTNRFGTDSATTPMKQTQDEVTTDDDPSDVFDDTNDDNDDDDNDSIWVCEDEKESLDGKHTTMETGVTQNKSSRTLEQLTIGEMAAKTTEHSIKKDDKQQPKQQQDTNQHCIYKKTVYSEPECILGHWHRVRLEAQLLSRSLLSSQFEGGLNSGGGGGGDGGSGGNKYKNHGQHTSREGQDETVLVCRFELQRDRSATKSIPSQHQQQQQQQQQQVGGSPNPVASHKNTNQRLPSKPDDDHHGSSASLQQTKIRYDIYCLNRHQVLDAVDYVDPEDKVLVPVSKVTEANDATERSSSYVKQVILNADALDTNEKIDVDIVVALEIFGFQKM